MPISNQTRRMAFVFVSLFLLCGAYRAFLPSLPLTHGLIQLLCMCLTLVWVLTIQRRIIDRRLRALMIAVALCMLLLYLLQIARYNLFQGKLTIMRYLWYAMYLPMTAQAALFCILAASIHRPKQAALPAWWKALLVVGALLALGYLTNDLHFQAKRFPSGVMDDNGLEKSGWLQYAITAYIVVCYALGYGLMLNKSRYSCNIRQRLLAALPFLIGALYFALYPLKLSLRLFPYRPWNAGEMLGFCIISTLEICIQSGMIPANRGYEQLFAAARLPAVIADVRGRLVHKTEAVAAWPFTQTEDVRLFSHPISGGRVEYCMDISLLRRLNGELQEKAQQIEARNAYLAQENRVKQERAQAETRNRLYDRISALVQPKIDLILALTNEDTDAALCKIAVLEAYIKRRSNMELMSQAGTLSALELSSAAAESLDFLRLCGIETALSASGSGIYPAQMIVCAYERLEAVLEACLESATDVICALRAENGEISLRVMLKADFFDYDAPRDITTSVCRCQENVIKDGPDIIVALRITEGGLA